MVRKVLGAVAVTAVVVIGGGYLLGFWSWDSFRDEVIGRERWAGIKTKAQVSETQIKAKAQDLMGDAPMDEEQAAETCRQNLRRIESAKRAVASRVGVAAGSVSWDRVLQEMGGQMPVCPKGGSYTLGTLELLPKCSIGANGTPDPKDDHLIKYF